jgi:hypothetical protein
VREANRQLKKATGGNLPALVVIFNNTDCSLHTDPYAVMTAMQGIDTIQVTVPPNLTESPCFEETTRTTYTLLSFTIDSRAALWIGAPSDCPGRGSLGFQRMQTTASLRGRKSNPRMHRTAYMIAICWDMCLSTNLAGLAIPNISLPPTADEALH